jgi:hypothetical protein
MANKPVDYKQYDSKWAGLDYSAKGETNTIKSAGCGIACAAMAIASLKNKTITPVDTAKWSKAHGYKIKGQGTAYTYFKPQLAEYGINCIMLNNSNVYHNKTASVHKVVLSELQKGNWIIAVMGIGRWTKGGHYVLCYAYDNGYVYINDSASTDSNRLKAKIEDWQYEVKYYWKIEIPEDKKIFINDTKTNKKVFDNIDWIKRFQKAIDAEVDGKTGNETLSKTPTIQLGTKGTRTKLLQEKLTALGYDTKGTDGEAGDNTIAAMKKFQKEVVGLKNPDGKFTAKDMSWKVFLAAK